MTPFEILYADPAWSYTDKATAGERGAAFKYPVMSVDDICALDVQAHMAPESACFMWATAPCLPEAFRVLAAWGYTYSTVAFCWAKTRSVRTVEARHIVRAGFPTMQARADRVVDELATAGLITSKLHIGMGQSTRANAEFVLLGLRGRMGRVDAGVRQILLSPLREHSAKPPEVRERIVQLLGDRPRLEMFARERAPGWSAWGNQVPGGSDVEIVARRGSPVEPVAPAPDPRQVSIFDVLAAPTVAPMLSAGREHAE